SDSFGVSLIIPALLLLASGDAATVFFDPTLPKRISTVAVSAIVLVEGNQKQMKIYGNGMLQTKNSGMEWNKSVKVANENNKYTDNRYYRTKQGCK
ncbi:hypothetical protein KI387_009869, partial [Taxus chinensis]